MKNLELKMEACLLTILVVVTMTLTSSQPDSDLPTSEVKYANDQAEYFVYGRQPFVQKPVVIQSPNAVISTTCGGVMEGQFGEISYKYGTPFEPLASCMWTISVGNYSSIKIHLLETFQRDHYGHYLQVGYFNKSNYDQPNSFTWIKLPGHISPRTVEVPGPVALVQFATCAAYIGLGFKLAFEAAGSIEPSIFTYDNYFLTGTSGKFNYPVAGGTYRNNQRTTVVIDSPTITESILYIQRMDVEASENCLVDSVNVYRYNYTANANAGEWSRVAILCGTQPVGAYSGVAMTGTEGHHHPMIITFTSDDSTVGQGFQAWWNLKN